MWYINLDRSSYGFVTIHACDGQTDGRTEFSSLDRVCIACSAVKIKHGSLEWSTYAPTLLVVEILGGYKYCNELHCLRFLYKKIIRTGDSERELSLRQHLRHTIISRSSMRTGAVMCWNVGLPNSVK